MSITGNNPDQWRVVFYPNGEFYMIWNGLRSDHIEYKSKEEALRAIRVIIRDERNNGHGNRS